MASVTSSIYRVVAPIYDVTSGERLVYRAGRVAGVEALRAGVGDTVLDLGCGTGLNFPLLVDAVGPTGRIIGLDSSAAMLVAARRRVAENGWRNVRLVEADATAFTAADLGVDRIDAMLATYALSVMSDSSAAWVSARAVLREGGRAAIVDLEVPHGPAAVLAPLARLAARLGGSDIEAHPWTALELEATEVSACSLRGGHIRVVAGTVG